ncbi:MAG: hypothetical protein L0Y80_05285 [Ignavibacteriae bacterium]|nr:hypothetical protein [Ignavibacteriota bacterium]
MPDSRMISSVLKRIPLAVVLCIALTGVLSAQWLPDPEIDESIQRGIGYIYNLEFENAEQEFARVVSVRPDHPAGYFFQAMIEWWRILIDIDDESRDEKFFDMLEHVITMCDERLKKDPNDVTALFFKGGAIGFRGRLKANRGSWFSAAQDGVAAMPIVRKAHELDQKNSDVLLGIGIYNYYAEVIPQEYPLLKPFMWFFPGGDRTKWLEQIQIASENAKYAHVESSYFLMQNYFFYEKQFSKALGLAKKLSDMFPRNPVFHRYLGRCYVRMGDWSEVYRVYSDIDKRCREHQTGYSPSDQREAAYYLGRFLFIGKTLDESLQQFTRCDELSNAVDDEDGSGFRTMANLHMGMIYDLQKKRSLAIMQYQKVLKMKEYEQSHIDARKYLKAPYHR